MPLSPLPIDQSLPEICEALRHSNCLVISAPPGSGKTTRVAPFLDDSGIFADKEIVILEPRRIATRMAARRVAQEREEPVGKSVGFHVRFESAAGPETKIRFMTEALLIRRMLEDPQLSKVGAVILDEFHERHIHTDLALCLTRQLQLSSRPDLRLGIMSATLDAQPISQFLGNCPIVVASGKCFDVTIEHLSKPEDRPLPSQVASALRQLIAQGLNGHVLVFLPGSAEIRRTWESCESIASQHGLELHRLHGDMSAAEQDRVLAQNNTRKVILSTNVAESSVTIDGITAVIDSGLARVAGHASWSGLPLLRLEKVSKSSAIQRAGRAGRTAPGTCLRLYTKSDYDSRAPYQVPELLRADLSESMLLLAATGLGSMQSMPWFEAPPADAILAAESMLKALGALDEKATLTNIGKQMAQIPSHPRVARLLTEARKRGIGPRAATLAAILGERDLRKNNDYSRNRRYGTKEQSDLLYLESSFEEAVSSRFSPMLLESLGLDQGSCRAVARAKEQYLRFAGRASAEEWDSDDDLLKCVLTAYPDRVARRGKDRELTMCTGGTAQLSESSTVDERFLVAVEAEERNDGKGRKIQVRIASGINENWLLDIFPDSVSDQTEAIWNEKSERVEWFERLLYRQLVIDESRSSGRGKSKAAELLYKSVVARGVHAFFGEGQLEQYLARLEFAAKNSNTGLEIDAAKIIVEETLREVCADTLSFDEIRKLNLLEIIKGKAQSLTRGRFDSLAPEKVMLSGGRWVKVNYETEKPPWIESRLQDFFGMEKGPFLADGKVAVVMHLLAPNYRAVQVTADLAGFWERHYPAIRKELMRKYPRHLWPEQGQNAAPPPPGKIRPPRT